MSLQEGLSLSLLFLFRRGGGGGRGWGKNIGGRGMDHTKILLFCTEEGHWRKDCPEAQELLKVRRGSVQACGAVEVK